MVSWLSWAVSLPPALLEIAPDGNISSCSYLIIGFSRPVKMHFDKKSYCTAFTVETVRITFVGNAITSLHVLNVNEGYPRFRIQIFQMTVVSGCCQRKQCPYHSTLYPFTVEDVNSQLIQAQFPLCKLPCRIYRTQVPSPRFVVRKFCKSYTFWVRWEQYDRNIDRNELFFRCVLLYFGCC